MGDWPRRIFVFVLWTLIFGIAYTQAPLYYSNQNQYFLHGLAEAGRGFLDEDWLANTADPTPVFSFLVRLTSQLSEALFHGYYLLILGLYFYALAGMFPIVAGAAGEPAARLVFMTSLVLVHAAVLRLASTHLLGVDYPWYFQAGLAGQYVLGFGLQPSVFGVLLLVSIHEFVRGHPWRAATLACLGATVHATYLLGAAFLVLAYQYLLLRDRRWRTAILLGVWSLALVAPVVIYNWQSFAPTSLDTFNQAQWLLAHFRIPHHAEPARWFDTIAAVQIVWTVLAILLARGTRLFAIMLIVFCLSAVLALVQVATGDDTLALLFPWRTSAILVPLATAVIFACIIQRLAPLLTRRSPLTVACTAAIVLAVAGGLVIITRGWGYRTNEDELPMMDYVRRAKKPGDVYLLPVQVPKLGSGPRGAFSTNFTPAPRTKETHLIAIDLQRFRIVTGAPIYVDFKSIPYKDTEVLDWRKRLLWADEIYTDKDLSAEDIRRKLERHGISHVVTTADRAARFAGLAEVYADKSYLVYQLNGEQEP